MAIVGITSEEIKNMTLFELGFVDEIDFDTLTLPIVKKVNRVYEPTKQAILADYSWRFSIRRLALGSGTDTFTSDATFITITTTSTYLTDGLPIVVTGSDLPLPLASGTTYYTVNSSGKTSQVSATLGGTAINLLDDGTGTQTLTYSTYATADDTFKYKYNYLLPNDMLTYNNSYHDAYYQSPIRQFETNQSVLNTDNTTAYLAYNANIDETEWPQYFINYFKYKLALSLAFNLTGDTQLMEILSLQAKDALRQARRTDARQCPTRTIKSSPLTQIRG